MTQPNPIESEGAKVNKTPNSVDLSTPKVNKELPDLDEILANLTRKAGVNNAENGKDMFKALGKGVFTDEQLRREAKAAIQSLIDEARLETLKKVAAHNNSEYTSDYIEQQIAELEDRLKSKGAQ